MPQADGTVVLQAESVSVQVDANCRLVSQPAYTLFPCPFFPNVDSFQGIIITDQGAQPINEPFYFTYIDVDFDEDGVVNEPGYVSSSTSSLGFEAYREDGTLKFAGYIVETDNYAWLYVFIFQAQ